jgi:hypothetical protein
MEYKGPRVSRELSRARFLPEAGAAAERLGTSTGWAFHSCKLSLARLALVLYGAGDN